MLPDLKGGRWMSLRAFHRWLVAMNHGHAPCARTIQRWCEKGHISASRLGGPKCWWIDMQALKTANEETREVYLDIVRAVNDRAA